MSNIVEAVQARENRPTPKSLIQAQLADHQAVVKKCLIGTGISEATFLSNIMNAVRTTSGLIRCAPETVLGAALKCAQLGLTPNDTRNLAFIIPYGTEATFQLGYGGVMELARRAMPGLKFIGMMVYPNDDFDLDYGRDNPLIHRPHFVKGMDRGGDAYLWYVKATFPDGTQQVMCLDRERVEYHRSFSKQKAGTMWGKSYDAAALKSVVMEMKRWLPASVQLQAAMDSDERVLTPNTVAQQIIEAESDEIDEIESGVTSDDNEGEADNQE